MKKFLKGLGIFFFGSGLIVYTSMFFTEAPELRPVFIIMNVIMGFFLFLLLRKKKPKQKAPPKTEPTVQVHSNLNPERAIKSMPGAYTVAEAQNHVRIVQDCLNIFEKTKNLETFFSRYEYGMQIALTLDQAAKAGIIPYTSDTHPIFQLLSSRRLIARRNGF